MMTSTRRRRAPSSAKRDSGGDSTQRFLVLIEKADGNYSAHVPDLPGCVTTGPSLAAVKRNIREAIEFHLEGLAEDGHAVKAETIGTYVRVSG